MALLSNRTGDVVATEDENADGRIDKKDDRIAARRGATLDDTTQVGAAKVDDTTVDVPTEDVERRRLRLRERTARAAKASTAVVEPDGTVVEPTVVRGPRPRASLTASLSLIVGVLAAVAVLSGMLAGPGVAIGLLASFLGLGGIAATSRRHVAGKSDALVGVALGLASIVVGVLALTGNLSWLNGDTDMLVRVHDWFAAHLSFLLP